MIWTLKAILRLLRVLSTPLFLTGDGLVPVGFKTTASKAWLDTATIAQLENWYMILKVL